MDPNKLDRLKAHRVGLAADWTRAVLATPTRSPLTLPETMVHHVVPALERIMTILACPHPGDVLTPDLIAEGWPPRRRCGQNPFRDFYLHGERIIFNHPAVRNDLSDADQADLQEAFRAVAAEEICAFDAVFAGVPLNCVGMF